MASELEINVKNLGVELATIRSEIDAESIILADIFHKKESLQSEMSAFNEEKAAFEAYKNKVLSDVSIAFNELNAAKINRDEEAKKAKEELKVIQEENRKCIRNLSKLNDSILHADDELKEKNDLKNKLDNDNCLLLSIVIHKEEEEKKLQEAINSRVAIEGRLESKRMSIDEQLSKKRYELSLIENDISENMKKLGIIQTEYKSYSDQLYTAMNDYQVVRSRLESRFNEHYPELELPLMV